jgi:hypothetical protein
MGFFDSLVARFRSAKVRHDNKQRFKKELLAAVADGKLTGAELAKLDQLAAELGLTNADIGRVRVTAYEAAFRVAKADRRISPEEERELATIKSYLQLPDSAIAKTQTEFTRLRLIWEIQHGNLPEVSAGSVILQKQEIAHWVEAARLIEERVVGRRYEGSSSGMSFRIAKGVTYRVGASRGRLVQEKANVPVSSGDLVLTNKRVVFRGDKKSFNYKLDKLLDVQLYSDGLFLTDTSGKPRVLTFASDENTDIVGSILTKAIDLHVNG